MTAIEAERIANELDALVATGDNPRVILLLGLVGGERSLQDHDAKLALFKAAAQGLRELARSESEVISKLRGLTARLEHLASRPTT